MQVTLGGADRHLARRGDALGDEVGFEHPEGSCHGPGGDEHLGHEDLAFLVELSDLGHGRDEALAQQHTRFDAVGQSLFHLGQGELCLSVHNCLTQLLEQRHGSLLHSLGVR